MWAAMTGDALTNYRAALDYLVYALAVVRSGADPPPKKRNLQFPIASTEENWKDALRRNRLFGLSEGVVAEIRAVQPYHQTEPDSNLFARLRDLNDPDKHRSLNLGVFALHQPKEVTLESAQYTSIRYTERLTNAGIAPSVGSVRAPESRSQLDSWTSP
jgi:hypothetical protein